MNKQKKARAATFDGPRFFHSCWSDQQLLNHGVTRLECFAEFFRQSAAAFGHVGFAATLAAYNRREFFNAFTRRYPVGKIIRGAHDQSKLAVTAEPEHHH